VVHVDAPVITSRLGVSPVSLEVLDAVVVVAQRLQTQLMIIASRNQVGPCPDAPGYVSGLTSDLLVRRLRMRASRDQVVICRDHAGPYLSWHDEGKRPEEALEAAAVTIEADVRAGFDLIHVDCGRFVGDVRAGTVHLLQRLESATHVSGRRVAVEIGTEDNTGAPVSLETFESDLRFILEHVHPVFIVGQTGSLVREMAQVGWFSLDHVRGLVRAVHDRHARFKEHNADYMDEQSLSSRNAAGVDAINIGPELGVLQTRAVVDLGEACGLSREVDGFLERSLRSRCWEKWLYGTPSDRVKALLAGHYNFSSPEYVELVAALERRIDVRRLICERLTARLTWYAAALAEDDHLPLLGID
jgi:hypothetical protein